MREIKFRAWIYDNLNKGRIFPTDVGKLYYAKDFGNSESKLLEFVEEQCDMTVDCLEQYTGLKDKNGVEIFEGDIIRDLITSTPKDVYSTKTVVYAKAMYRLRSNARRTSSPLGWPALCCLEVIGNIHDNPELLEGSAHGQTAESTPRHR